MGRGKIPGYVPDLFAVMLVFFFVGVGGATDAVGVGGGDAQASATNSLPVLIEEGDEIR